MEVKSRWVGKVGLLFTLALWGAACAGGEDVVPDTSTTTTGPQGTSTTVSDTSTTTEPGPTGTLVVWVDSVRAPVVEAAAQTMTTETGAEVTVEVVGFNEIASRVLTAAPAGEGPDLFVAAHESTGELVRAGIVSPVGFEDRHGEFFQVAIDAFTYEGEVYAVPFTMEAVGLYHNKALAPDPPATFAALRETCDALGLTADDGVPCLAIPVGEPLHQFPFIGGYGGYVFGFQNGVFDTSDIGLDSAAAKEGATFLSRLYADGYADPGVDYTVMADLFNQGTVPFMWTGPWQIESVDAAGIDYGVVGLPAMEGNVPRPFVGVQGFYRNSFSENTTLAETFLLDYLATTANAAEMAVSTYRPPAMQSAVDQISNDSILVAFAESAGSGIPLPNVPEMASTWSALSEAFMALSQGAEDPGEVMSAAADSVRSALGSG
jgi:maltose-binding protein MalE